MDGAREIRKGETLDGLPADGWNFMMRMAKRVERMTGPGNSPGMTPGNFPSIEVFNKTGSDITAEFPILKLSKPVLTIDDGPHIDREPILFEGVTPDEDTTGKDIAILQGPVTNDDSVWAIFSGWSWVDVDVTDAGHSHARPIDGDNTKLESAKTGLPIVWKPSGTGTLRCAVGIGGTGAETFRLIRGQSVGAQSGATVLIDNVLELAGGLDPSDGNAATQITVHNLFGQSFSDNEAVQAIYHEGLGTDETDSWEAVKTTAGSTGYRAIRGLAVGNVAANATSFSIDNVIPLAGGLDPVSGNPATTVTVENIQKEAFRDNEPVTAIYDGTNWEVLLVERYRMIRGETTGSVTSGNSTFNIDGIEVLCSGLDPRSDPTSSSETVTVSNIHADEYAADAKVIAVWNVTDGVWEALPRVVAASGGNSKFGKADANITALSGSTLGSGTVSVWEISGTTVSDSGNNETWYNLADEEIPAGVFIAAVEIDSKMIVIFQVC